MNYDSKSSEAIMAFDLTFSFYRPRHEEEFSFLSLADANECALIALEHLKTENEDKFDFYCRVEQIIRWNIKSNYLKTLKKIKIN
jgi:hypothetical protein